MRDKPIPRSAKLPPVAPVAYGIWWRMRMTTRTYAAPPAHATRSRWSIVIVYDYGGTVKSRHEPI